MIPALDGAHEHPKGVAGHGGVGGQNLPAVCLCQGHLPAAFIQTGGAAVQHPVGGALGVLHQGVSLPAKDGHHFAARVKGGFGHPGTGGPQGGAGISQPGAPVHKGAFRGLAHGGSGGFVVLGIAAQGHGPGQGRFTGPPVADHGHFVLGEGAGLVGADDLGAAQRLHGGETADDGPPAAHGCDAHGQNHGDHSRQPLGNGRHRQRHRHEKGVQRHAAAESARPEGPHRENDGADGQHQPGEGLAQPGQAALQGCLLLPGLGQRAGDAAHLGVHAGGGDHGGPPAVGHRAAHVDHVFPVAQGDVSGAAELQGFGEFGHRDALAGEGGFLGLETGTFQQAAVGGDGVAGLQQHHVAHHQLFAGKHGHPPLPQHPGGGGGHGLEGLDGLLGLAFLIDAQGGVYDDHRQDDDHIGQAFAGP